MTSPSDDDGSTAPFETLELRWFWPRGATDTGADAPRRLAEVAQHTVDRYAPSGADCGIKLRGRRLEVKQRTDGLARLRDPDSGHAYQGWRKWTLPATGDWQVATGDWLAVTKHRELAFDEIADVTLQVERARIEVLDQRWWTLALELSGTLDTLEPGPVQDLARQRLHDFNGHLRDSYCGSYPAWLAAHFRDGVPA